MVLLGQTWSYLVLFDGPNWSYVVLLGPMWSYLVLLDGPTWSYLVLLGPMWSYAVLLGPTWSYVFKSYSKLSENCLICQVSKINFKISESAAIPEETDDSIETFLYFPNFSLLNQLIN